MGTVASEKRKWGTRLLAMKKMVFKKSKDENYHLEKHSSKNFPRFSKADRL